MYRSKSDAVFILSGLKLSDIEAWSVEVGGDGSFRSATSTASVQGEASSILTVSSGLAVSLTVKAKVNGVDYSHTAQVEDFTSFILSTSAANLQVGKWSL